MIGDANFTIWVPLISILQPEDDQPRSTEPTGHWTRRSCSVSRFWC